MYDHELSVAIQQERERAIREARLHHRLDLDPRAVDALRGCWRLVRAGRQAPVAAGVRTAGRKAPPTTQAAADRRPAGRPCSRCSTHRARLTAQGRPRSVAHPVRRRPGAPSGRRRHQLPGRALAGTAPAGPGRMRSSVPAARAGSSTSAIRAEGEHPGVDVAGPLGDQPEMDPALRDPAPRAGRPPAGSPRRARPRATSRGSGSTRRWTSIRSARAS